MNLCTAIQWSYAERTDELADLLAATADAYTRHFSSLCSIILFGGITLGEFHPHFSDVDLAIIFDDEVDIPPKKLPEAIRSCVTRFPLFGDTHISPKHVKRSELAAMQYSWQRWARETAGQQKSGITETLYPFTLCDTWMLHRHGITLTGEELIDKFPFPDAPPTTPEIELQQVKWYADNFAMERPFSMGECEELLGEVIYYATTFTRAIYTLHTGQVIGRVAGAHWYADTFTGETGRFAWELGEMRRACRPGAKLPANSPELLWALFIHYAREALAYAGFDKAVPEPTISTADFSAWLRKLYKV